MQNLHSADVQRVAFRIHKEGPVVQRATGEFAYMIWKEWKIAMKSDL